MPKFIKSIVDRINLANRKGLSAYYSPDQIVDEVHAESNNLWLKYLKDYERTQELSVIMDVFKGKETVTLTSGAGTLVTSLSQYKIGVLTATDKVVEQIDIAHWGYRNSHSVRVPTTDYPICRIDQADIIVRPITVTPVYVHFLKKPTKPVYTFTTVDDDYVYDDSTSIDFEWGIEVHDQIMNRVLANLGISIRSGELVQYSNIEQTKEGR